MNELQEQTRTTQTQTICKNAGMLGLGLSLKAKIIFGLALALKPTALALS